MNTKQIIDFILDYAKRFSITYEGDTSDVNNVILNKLIDNILEEEGVVWRGGGDSHRHWEEHTVVYTINGKFIGAKRAYATGDTGVTDLGWRFSCNSLFWAKPKEITNVVFVRAEGVEDANIVR